MKREMSKHVGYVCAIIEASFSRQVNSNVSSVQKSQTGYEEHADTIY